ncbi:hypothetical protein IJ670_04460 [bacterium]|nr:hypothetical protein [bacterium]
MPVNAILPKLESDSAIGMFVKDTGGCLLSRLALSRTKDETREISIAELTESALFYFSAPLIAKMGGKIFPELFKKFNMDSLKQKSLATFSQIISTFGLLFL